MRYGDLNVEDVMTAITLVSQSKRSLQLDSKLEITASTLVIPSGHGRKRHLYESHVLSKAKNTRLVTQLYAKSSIVKIDATDMCAFRSVVVGMAFIKSKKVYLKYLKMITDHLEIQKPIDKRLKHLTWQGL